MVADYELFCDAHVHVLVGEFESQYFLGHIQHDWISLCLHKEVKGSIVDVVGDWSAERLGGLAAEHDVEASFLAWWNHLGEWATLL